MYYVHEIMVQEKSVDVIYKKVPFAVCQLWVLDLTLCRFKLHFIHIIYSEIIFQNGSAEETLWHTVINI